MPKKNNMKEIPKYITSVRIQNAETEHLNISLGFEKNGAMRIYFQDTAELGLDQKYINEASYPNSGIMSKGKYSLWISMFVRDIKPPVID